MSSFYFDKVSLNDYEMKPERFNNDQDKHARLYCVESIGTWFLNGTDNPPNQLLQTHEYRFSQMGRNS